MIGEVCTRDTHCDTENCCFKRESDPNHSCLCDRPECRRKESAEIVLHLTKKQFAHIMGSVSQDDAEYVVCPEPLKNYLEEMARKHEVVDQWGSILKIGW